MSNHAGYSHWKGGELNSDELQELYDGLKLNKVNQMTICSQLHERRALFLARVAGIVWS